MKISEDRKRVKLLVFFFSLTYMMSYVTRINYGAVISEMQTATGFSRELLSMAPTGSFITYAAGQIISGIMGDKLSPKKLIMCGFGLTALMNLLIPLCRSPFQMLAVWCINGFAQSFMWPPLLKIIAAVLSDDDYAYAIVRISNGGSLGTILVYLLSPLLITLLGWRSVFVVSGVLGAVMLLLWSGFKCRVSAEAEEVSSESHTETEQKFFTPLMLFIMLSIILHGTLKDGVTTWLPTYISEAYRLSSSISILSGVILPLFSILCINAAKALYRTKIKNLLSCSALFFFVSAAASGMFFVLDGKSVAVSVSSAAVITGCMHGVNLMLISIVPNYFRNSGKISTVSGILNCCTYVGSAASTYGIALLSEKFGWSFTLLSWIIIGAAGAFICFFFSRRKNMFSENPTA